ncbi:LuxR C-terminal-related transcriptional regulator [Nocardioides sp.]|uniref:helix-turn-helix transcriptional regulator n=1 Tax=Nocardioides sp. TaxID=35761 RepID=UPI00356799EA
MPSSTRVLQRIEAAVSRGSDLVTLWREVGPLLHEAVPHFEAPCFFTVDPGSLLTTSHFQEGLPEIPANWLGREYLERDYNSMTEVLLSPSGIGTLHEATDGKPALSRKYHEEMQPFGCEQELVVALRTRDGEAWGAVGLYREQGRPLFDETEMALLRVAAPMLAEGARFGLRLAHAREPDLPDAPGMIVLDPDLALVSASPLAQRWVEELGGKVEDLPASVLAVAGQALQSPDGPAQRPASARVRGVGGRWLSVSGAVLEADAGVARVSVVIDAARPAHVESLLVRVYGLTPRERDVAGLVVRGASNQQVAAELGVAVDTVQQHLSSIFDKTGVRSRAELVGVLFHTHFEPRVRDNERRTLDVRASRPGPMGQGPMGPG